MGSSTASSPEPLASSARRTVLVLALFWAALLPLFVVWLHEDLVFAPWDEAHHAWLVLKLHDGLARFNPWSVYELSKYYPPLFHVLAVPATLVSTHPDAFCLGNWLALLALMLATCWIARPLLGAPAGLAAGLLVPSYVYVTWMGRMVMTDLTLAATVAATLALLAREAPLGDARAARRLGLAIGLGMLAKWSYAFFLALPLAWTVLAQARRAGGRAVRRPLAIAAGVAALVAGPWYVRSVGRIWREAAWHFGSGVVEAEGDPPSLSLASLRYYPQALAEFYLTTPHVALLLVGAVALAMLLLGRARRAALAPPARWIPILLSPLSGWLVLLAITNKDVRYVLPMVSVFATVSVAPLVLLRGRRAQGVALAGVALLSYGLVWWNLFRLSPPSTVDWQVERAAEVLAREMRARGRPFDVLVVPNDWHMNFMSIDYATERLLREKVTVDRVHAPLERADLARYGAVVTVEPPVEETPLSRGSVAGTELVASDPGWRELAALPRGDGRTVRIRVPRGFAPQDDST